ncbi:MAG: hypothetical protein DMG60_06495 [Acidobacteria bacterium]|nr:MAG: hypothetical protein DMG60_06495 [Acidobacteriota bacterium]
MLFEAAVQQQPGLLFRVAYECMQPVFAQRAHAIHVSSISVSDEEPGFLTAVQHSGPKGRSGANDFVSTHAEMLPQ